MPKPNKQTGKQVSGKNGGWDWSILDQAIKEREKEAKRQQTQTVRAGGSSSGGGRWDWSDFPTTAAEAAAYVGGADERKARKEQERQEELARLRAQELAKYGPEPIKPVQLSAQSQAFLDPLEQFKTGKQITTRSFQDRDSVLQGKAAEAAAFGANSAALAGNVTEYAKHLKAYQKAAGNLEKNAEDEARKYDAEQKRMKEQSPESYYRSAYAEGREEAHNDLERYKKQIDNAIRSGDFKLANDRIEAMVQAPLTQEAREQATKYIDELYDALHATPANVKDTRGMYSVEDVERYRKENEEKYGIPASLALDDADKYNFAVRYAGKIDPASLDEQYFYYQYVLGGQESYQTKNAKNAYLYRTENEINRARQNPAASGPQIDSFARSYQAINDLNKMLELLDNVDMGVSADNINIRYLADDLKNYGVKLGEFDDANVLSVVRNALKEQQEKHRIMEAVLRQSGYDPDLIRSRVGYEQTQRHNADAQKSLEEWAKTANGWDKAAATLGAIAEDVYLSPFEYLFDTLPRVASGASERNPNQYVPALGTTRQGDAVKAAIGNEMSGAGRFLYNTAVSGIESAIGGLSFGEAGYLLAMGLRSADAKTNEVLQKGGSRGQAFWSGVASGTIEAASEIFSLQELIKLKDTTGIKQIAKGILTAMGFEASEEIAGGIADAIVDPAILGNLSDKNQAVRAYMNDGMAYDDAAKQAWTDQVLETLEGALSAGLSAGVSGPIYSAAGKVAGWADAHEAKEGGRKAASSMNEEVAQQTLLELAALERSARDSGDTQNAKLIQSYAKGIEDELKARAKSGQTEAAAEDGTPPHPSSAATPSPQGEGLETGDADSSPAAQNDGAENGGQITRATEQAVQEARERGYTIAVREAETLSDQEIQNLITANEENLAGARQEGNLEAAAMNEGIVQGLREVFDQRMAQSDGLEFTGALRREYGDDADVQNGGTPPHPSPAATPSPQGEGLGGRPMTAPASAAYDNEIDWIGKTMPNSAGAANGYENGRQIAGATMDGERAMLAPTNEQEGLNYGAVQQEQGRIEPASAGAGIRRTADDGYVGQAGNGAVSLSAGERGGHGREWSGGVSEQTRRQGKGKDQQSVAKQRQEAAADNPLMSPAELGVPLGSGEETCRILSEGEWDDEVREACDKAKANGIRTFRAVVGQIMVECNGEQIPMNGAIDRDTRTMIIRADSVRDSVSEITEHEIAHMQTNRAKVREFMESVKSRYKEAAWTAMYQAYENRYRDVTNDYANMSEDEKELYVWEEIQCDAAARAKKFGTNAAAYHAEAAASLDSGLQDSQTEPGYRYEGGRYGDRQNAAATDRTNGPGQRFAVSDEDRQFMDDKELHDNIAFLINEMVQEGKYVTVSSEEILNTNKEYDWSDEEKARAAIQEILHAVAGVRVRFSMNGKTVSAYLTKQGWKHGAGNNNTPQKGATYKKFIELADNAEYAGSQYDKNLTPEEAKKEDADRIDKFATAANVDGTWYAVVFVTKDTVLDGNDEHHIYAPYMQEETPVSNKGGEQQKADVAHLIYGASKVSGDNITEDGEDVKRNTDTDYKDYRFSAAEDERDDGLTFTGNLRRTYEEDDGQVDRAAETGETSGRQSAVPTDAEDDGLTFTGNLRRTYEEDGGQIARATDAEKEIDWIGKPASNSAQSGQEKGFTVLSPERRAARAELRKELMELFHIAEGSRKRIADEIDIVADELIKMADEKGVQNASLSEEEKKSLYRKLYDAGVETQEADAYFAGIRQELKGKHIFVDQQTRQDFGDDYNAFRKRAWGNNIYLTADTRHPGVDVVVQELADSYPGSFDAAETDPRAMLEKLLDVAEKGKNERISNTEAMRRRQELTGERSTDQLKAMKWKADQLIDDFIFQLGEGWSGMLSGGKNGLTQKKAERLEKMFKGKNITDKASWINLVGVYGEKALRDAGFTPPQQKASQGKKSGKLDTKELLGKLNLQEAYGTDALEEIGVKVNGSVADYSMVKQILANDKAAKSVQRELAKAEKRLNASAKEKQFAAGIAAGYYTREDVPSTMDEEKVLELADYYMAEQTVQNKTIRERRAQIREDLGDQMARLFKTADEHESSSMLVLNERTPERNMRHIFGDELGEKINKAIFYPVQANEAERIRFINRMHDAVRTFQDSSGKQTELTKAERAVAQMLLEGKGMEHIAASAELSEAVKNAAKDIAEGKDMDAVFKEQELSSEDRETAAKLASWQNASKALETGKLDNTRVKNAVKAYSELYNQLYAAINDFLVGHGYEPIGFRKDYAPHMQPEETRNLLQKAFQHLGVNAGVTELPASIAGLTADFKPSKRWNPHFLERTGNQTEYDIAKGFEEYIEYISDIFYHMDDTMRVREAVKYFRETFAPEEIRDEIERAKELRYAPVEDKLEFLRDEKVIEKDTIPSDADVDAMMDDYLETLYGRISKTTKHSNLVMWLDNYANLLAGKQSMADRGQEYSMGRKVANWASKMVRTFAQSKVAGNLSSVLNQGAQLPMIYSELGTRWTAAAAKDVLTGKLRKADWWRQSDFLTGKHGVDYLVRTPGEMVMSAMFKPAEMMDSMVSTIAVRGKYLEEIKAGKSHEEAMEAADRFGQSIMGSRAKGSRPLAYSGKGIISQMVHIFQVEAVNSWEHLSQDLPRDFREIEKTKGKGKAALALAGVITKMLLAAFVINRLDDELYGGTPAPFDLFGLTSNFIASGEGLTTNEWLKTVVDNGVEKISGKRIFGTDASRLGNENFNWDAAIEDTAYNISNEVPFVRNLSGVLGWGDQSLPMPDLYGKASDVVKAAKSNGVFSAETGKAALKAATELLPGGNQINKAAQGIEAAVRGGDFSGYGDKEKLKYPLEEGLPSALRAILFGKYATKESDAYYAAGDKTLTERQTALWKELVGSGIKRQEAYQAIQDFRKIKKEEGEESSYMAGKRKRDLIADLPWTDEQKIAMYKSLVLSSDSEKKIEAIQAFQDAGLRFNAFLNVQDAYSRIDNELDDTGEKAAAFSQWVNRQGYTPEQNDTIKEYFKYWRHIPAAATRYDSFVEAGLDDDAAMKLHETIAALEPEEGKDQVSNLQKYEAVVDSGLSEQDQMLALQSMMGEDEYFRLEVGTDFGVTPKMWVTYKRTIPDYDADKNGGYTQEEVTNAINAMNGLSKEQRAALWQMANKSWKAKNNPFNAEVGEEIYNALHN